MEEDSYKAQSVQLISRPCPFAKAILTQNCGCAQAQRVHLAEREIIGCQQAPAWQQCGQWLQQLKINARFTLRLDSLNAPLPHAQMMKLQCGGLRGLQAVLGVREPQAIEDIHQLLKQACQQFGGCEHAPYAEIIAHIQRFQGRAKRRSR